MGRVQSIGEGCAISILDIRKRKRICHESMYCMCLYHDVHACVDKTEGEDHAADVQRNFRTPSRSMIPRKSVNQGERRPFPPFEETVTQSLHTNVEMPEIGGC